MVTTDNLLAGIIHVLTFKFDVTDLCVKLIFSVHITRFLLVNMRQKPLIAYEIWPLASHSFTRSCECSFTLTDRTFNVYGFKLNTYNFVTDQCVLSSWKFWWRFFFSLTIKPYIFYQPLNYAIKSMIKAEYKFSSLPTIGICRWIWSGRRTK